MNAPTDSYSRWRDAEEAGRDEDADRAFRSVFQALAQEKPVAPAFATRTLAAVTAAAERDRRRARRTRVAAIWGAVVGGSVAAYFGSGWAVSFLTSAFIGLLNVLIGAVVNGAMGLDAGAGVWSILASLGRAAGAFVADPKVTLVILAIQLIAMAALVALRRLLGVDGESFE